MPRLGRNQTHRLTAEQRFVESISPQTNGCWYWTATRLPQGYGHFWDGSRVARAHRWAYEHWIGEIPPGLVIDHLCRVRNCVNPLHLEAVTQRENVLRGNAPAAKQAAQTECIHGHEFNEENTYTKKNGARQCRICRQAANNRRRQREAAAARLATEHRMENVSPV